MTFCCLVPGAPPVDVKFDYQAWVQSYPEMANVDEATATGYFNQMKMVYVGILYRVCDPTGATQLMLLNLLTAHLAQLFASQVNGQPNTQSSGAAPAPGLVGRIASATEGSVSVTTAIPELPQAAAWLSQTKYGLFFWDATKAYRTMIYVPGPRQRRRGFGRLGLGLGGYGSVY